MREVPRLVSDSVWSSVLVSEVELSVGGVVADGTESTETLESVWSAWISMLGVTWKRPIVWGEVGTELDGDGVGLGLLQLISLTAGFIGELWDDNVISGLSDGEEDRSDEDVRSRPSALDFCANVASKLWLLSNWFTTGGTSMSVWCGGSCRAKMGVEGLNWCEMGCCHGICCVFS